MSHNWQIVDGLECRLPEDVVRPDFAAIVDEGDRFVARIMYLKKMETGLSKFADTDKPEAKIICFGRNEYFSKSEIEKNRRFNTIMYSTNSKHQ